MADTVTTPEVAALLGKSSPTVSKYVRDGKLHPVGRQGLTYLFDRAEVEGLAQGSPNGHQPGPDTATDEVAAAIETLLADIKGLKAATRRRDQQVRKEAIQALAASLLEGSR